jgi:hypothetical protein
MEALAIAGDCPARGADRVAADDRQHLDHGTDVEPLRHGVPLLTDDRTGMATFLPVFIAVRQLVQGTALLRRHLGNGVIEARDSHPTLLVVQVGEQSAQFGDRVDHSPGHRAAMDVLGGPVDLDGGLHRAAHAMAHRGMVRRPEHRVAEHHQVDVGPTFTVVLEQVREMLRTRLLLALHQHLDVHLGPGRPVGREVRP